MKEPSVILLLTNVSLERKKIVCLDEQLPQALNFVIPISLQLQLCRRFTFKLSGSIQSKYSTNSINLVLIDILNF